MPKIVTDIVDTYVFRKVNGRTQFLVLRRKTDGPAFDVWQAIHSKVMPGETALDAAKRDIHERTGITPTRFYTADYIAQFYDHHTDSILFAPALAAQVAVKSRVTLSPDFSDYAWCDLEETTARLIWSAQRWAVRHIYDVIAVGGEESDMYEI
jgi:dihydroneopterin triphosphate diphosphatase